MEDQGIKPMNFRFKNDCFPSNLHSISKAFSHDNDLSAFLQVCDVCINVHTDADTIMYKMSRLPSYQVIHSLFV